MWVGRISFSTISGTPHKYRGFERESVGRNSFRQWRSESVGHHMLWHPVVFVGMNPDPQEALREPGCRSVFPGGSGSWSLFHHRYLFHSAGLAQSSGFSQRGVALYVAMSYL